MKTNTKKFQKRIPVCLDESMHKTLHKLSEQHGKTISCLVRQAISRFTKQLQRTA